MTTWAKLITECMGSTGDTLSDLEANTLSYADMFIEFDAGFGGIEGKPFTAWSANYVYFPVSYDGMEWVGAVPRNPNGQPSGHFGGGG